VERVFGRRFSSRRHCTWTNVEARSASFLLFLMAAALYRAFQRDRRGGGIFERHRCRLRRRAGETRGVLIGGRRGGGDSSTASMTMEKPDRAGEV
jgi:hypothetical protein